MSMPVCVHNCAISQEYTERFNENEDDTYENEKKILGHNVVYASNEFCNANQVCIKMKYQIVTAFTI